MQQSGAGAESENVILSVEDFVLGEGAAEMLLLPSDNVNDHLAAATRFVMGTDAPMLERSVFTENQQPESVVVMARLARRLWLSALHERLRDDPALSEQVRGNDGAGRRLRVGMYFYQGNSSRAEPA